MSRKNRTQETAQETGPINTEQKEINDMGTVNVASIAINEIIDASKKSIKEYPELEMKQGEPYSTTRAKAITNRLEAAIERGI